MSPGPVIRSPRVLWIAGIALLVVSVVGARFFFGSAHGSAAGTGDETVRPAIAMSIGYVDNEHGIASLYPTQNGRVVEIRAEGYVARKGDWLIKIDNRLAKLRLAEAETLYEQAKALPEQQQQKIKAIRHRKAAADLDIKTYKRAFDLKISDGADLLAKAEELAKQIDCELKVEELVDPTLALKRAKAVYDEAKLAVDECNVVAPENGTLLRCLVHVGEVLGPNPKYPAVQFAQEGKKIIRAEVLQEWASRYKEKQEVDIVDDTYSGPTWHGTIKSLSKWYAHKRSIIFEPFTLNDARSLECIIEINEKDGESLRIGQRVRVAVIKTAQ